MAGLDVAAAALLGLAVAMSSSVVVVNITRSRRRTTSIETNHLLLGWSVLQDVIGVGGAIILLAALGAGQPLVFTLLGLAAFAGIAVATAFLLPRVLARLRSESDLFLAVTVATGLAVAGAGAVLAGIPLALAAFVAGLTITEGPVRRRHASACCRSATCSRSCSSSRSARSSTPRAEPRPRLARAGPRPRGVSKVVVTWALARATRLPASPAQLAVGLGQIGEFGFVLGSAAIARGAIANEAYVALIAAVAVSIAVSTVAVRFVGRPTAPRRAGREPPDDRARHIAIGRSPMMERPAPGDAAIVSALRRRRRHEGILETSLTTPLSAGF